VSGIHAGSFRTTVGWWIPETVEEVPQCDDQRLNCPIRDCYFSLRVENVFDRRGVKTVGQLTQLSARDLLDEPNFGEASLKEVRAKLRWRGLSLLNESEFDNGAERSNGQTNRQL
jgi:DNA-directed RNA polymerase alpha subunit